MESLLRSSALLRRGCLRRRGIASTLSFSNCSFSSSAGSTGELATRRLYRILQRQCAAFSKTLPSHSAGESMFLLQPPLESRNSGHNRTLTIKTVDPNDDDNDDIRMLLLLFREWNQKEEDIEEWYTNIVQKETASHPADPSDALDRFYAEKEKSSWSTVSSIRNAIRYAFKNTHLPSSEDSKSSTEDDEEEMLRKFRRRVNKFAIRAVKHLTEQAEMWRLTSVSYDKGVRVVATSKCIGDSLVGGPAAANNMPKTKYRFNYRIRVENLSDQDTFQLLGRHWLIHEMDPEDGRTPVGIPIVVNAPNSGAGTIYLCVCVLAASTFSIVSTRFSPNYVFLIIFMLVLPP